MIYTKDMIKKELEKKEILQKRLRLLYIPIIIFIVLGCVSIVYQKMIEKKMYTNVFGYNSFIVLTGSMEPEINRGDMVLVKPVSQLELQVGKVITYEIGSSGQTVTHRIVQKVEKDGNIYYQTKGDNNNSADPELVPYDKVIGVVKMCFPKIGNVLSFLRTTGGLATFLLILLLSWSHSMKKNDRILAREEARKKFNICRYQKYENMQ